MCRNRRYIETLTAKNEVNRQTILASIHRHLHDSVAETGEVRPLGEIVAQVAGELRTSEVTASVGVVPVSQVAAFVDDSLTDQEAEIICSAVLTDNSVLAELIAAIRARNAPANDLLTLSDELTDRISGLIRAELPTIQRDAASNVNGSIDDPSTVSARAVVQLNSGKAERGKRLRNKKSITGLWVVLATVAAVIAIAIIAFQGEGGSSDS